MNLPLPIPPAVVKLHQQLSLMIETRVRTLLNRPQLRLAGATNARTGERTYWLEMRPRIFGDVVIVDDRDEAAFWLAQAAEAAPAEHQATALQTVHEVVSGSLPMGHPRRLSTQALMREAEECRRDDVRRLIEGGSDHPGQYL